MNFKKILINNKKFTTTFELYDSNPYNGIKASAYRLSSMKITNEPKKKSNINNKSMTSNCTLSTNFSKIDTDSGKHKINQEAIETCNQVSKKFLIAQEKWRINYYATIIQKIFRGYFYRTYIYNKKRKYTYGRCIKVYSKKIMFDHSYRRKNNLGKNYLTGRKKIGISCFNLSSVEAPKIKEIIINFNKKQ